MSSDDPKFTPPGTTGFKVKIKDSNPAVYLCESGSNCTWSSALTGFSFDAEWNCSGSRTKHMAKSTGNLEVTLNATSAGNWGSLEPDTCGGYRLPHTEADGSKTYLGNVASMSNSKIVLGTYANGAILVKDPPGVDSAEP